MEAWKSITPLLYKGVLDCIHTQLEVEVLVGRVLSDMWEHSAVR